VDVWAKTLDATLEKIPLLDRPDGPGLSVMGDGHHVEGTVRATAPVYRPTDVRTIMVAR